MFYLLPFVTLLERLKVLPAPSLPEPGAIFFDKIDPNFEILQVSDRSFLASSRGG